MSALLVEDLPGLLGLYEFDEQTIALARGLEQPVHLVSRLLTEQHFGSAVTFLAHSLE